MSVTKLNIEKQFSKIDLAIFEFKKDRDMEFQSKLPFICVHVSLVISLLYFIGSSVDSM